MTITHITARKDKSCGLFGKEENLIIVQQNVTVQDVYEYIVQIYSVDSPLFYLQE